MSHRLRPKYLHTGIKALPNTSGWTIRVVTNKFSALNLDHEFHISQENPLKVSSYAAGIAEVVIESPISFQKYCFRELMNCGYFKSL